MLFHTFTRHVGAWNRCFMSANTSPSLNFCSSSSKAKPEAMKEIWDNTSVDPCLDLWNGLMRPYLAVPTYLMKFLWIFSPHLGWLKGGTFRPCLSYLASSLKSIEENIILWFLNIRHSYTLFCMWFLTSAQQLFLLILPSIGWICGAHG
jgi:hypothetical protein